MRQRTQHQLVERVFISILLAQLFICFHVIVELPVASAKPECLNNDNVAGDQYSTPGLRPEIVPSPQTKLPDRAADIVDSKDDRPRDATAASPDAPAMLRGRADATALSATAELITNPLSRYRGDNLVFYQIYIKNGGPTPVLVLGKDAQMAEAVKTMKAAALEKQDNTLLTPKEKALVTAVGVGSAGLASILFYEHMTPSEHKKRDLGIALGRDRGRHEVESENLGTRLMMPGDETLGWLAFEDNDVVKSRNFVNVPVMFPPYSAVAATLKIPISRSSAPPLTPTDKPAAKNE